MTDIYLLAIEQYERAVAAGAPRDVCHICGAHVGEGLKGCWELFTNMGLESMGDPLRGAARFYTVDTHCLQHPEIHGKKNNAAHLLRLAWVFERGAQQQAASGVPKWWQHWIEHTAVPALEPPRDRGALTVADVAALTTPTAQAQMMQAWARAVYAAWQPHHAWARAELARVLK